MITIYRVLILPGKLGKNQIYCSFFSKFGQEKLEKIIQIRTSLKEIQGKPEIFKKTILNG